MSTDDLTARARIRDTALRLFAERGIQATSVRDIARAAGVSPGLLRHHFGSKDALRDACDTYALQRVMDIKTQVVLDGGLNSPGFMASVEPDLLLLKQYLARAVLDGSPAAAAMFDDIVARTEAWLNGTDPELAAAGPPPPTRDPRAYAAVLTAMNLGMLVLHEHLSRALGADMLGPEGHARAMLATVEILSTPLVGPELAEQAEAAFSTAHPTTPQSRRTATARSQGAQS
jgi:TetR/AcrR family transcriptional regulator, regulator of cefoperazone and chloramphenicol sensitivity